MTNSKLLQEKIDESGYKLKFIAGKLGISYYGFLLKRDGKSDFRAKEIQTLCKLLNISDAEMTEIFFAENVDNISTLKGART